MPTAPQAPRVPAPAPDAAPLLVRADATPAMGVGHAMRCLALAQAARVAGHRVVLSGELAVDWVAAAYADSGVEVVPPSVTGPELTALARRVEAGVVLLDGYHLSTDLADGVRAAGIRVGAMVDGPFGAHQSADLFIDQNPGSSPRAVTPPARALAGANYTLFRDDVIATRVARAADGPNRRETRRVLAVFGGTDPFGAAPVVAPLVAEAAQQAGLPIQLDVVSRDDSVVESLRGQLPLGSSIQVMPALTDLAARAAVTDLVVTASGSTVWELLCIGVPTAVVCVAENQTPGYDVATENDLVAGVGHLEPLRSDASARRRGVNALQEALTDEAVRARRSAAGTRLLDGLGRQRVLEALFAL